ncbi:MAG: radical SAM protein [Planctomycetaceae bacterium]|nr:B12-binding domain-containing radical SAM protein [Planctomycetaceae bacterium]
MQPNEPAAFRHAVCVYPYRRELNEAGFWPPLGLEFIAAVVQRHARTLDVVDLRMEKGRTGDFLRPETDLVCFSVNWDLDREFLDEEIRSVPPGILTIVGGRHATECPERWLTEFPNIDAVVRGDGEEAMEELCRGVPMDEVAGLSFRKDGLIRHNPNRTLGQAPDDLYPDRRLRRGAYVLKIKGVSTGLKVDSIATSRGCPFQCKFCSFNRNPWGEKRKWTARSPESVVDELGQMDARLVGFTDDLFTHDMDRVERICDLILARGIRKQYIVNARLEIARRPEVLRKMERAGFLMLLLGIESAHDKTLQSMQKGFGVARIRKYFEVLRHSRMILHGYFILGCIGESVKDMLAIGPFARQLGLDTIGLSCLRYSPYSGLDELVAQSPGYQISSSGKIYSDHCSGKQMRRVRRQIHREFYTAAGVARMARKGLQVGAVSLLPGVLPYLPKIALRWMTYLRDRSRRRAQKRRDGAAPLS